MSKATLSYPTFSVIGCRSPSTARASQMASCRVSGASEAAKVGAVAAMIRSLTSLSIKFSSLQFGVQGVLWEVVERRRNITKS